MEKTKKIIISISVLIAIFIIILLTILTILKSNNETQDNITDVSNADGEQQQIQEVKDINKLYNAEEIINNLLNSAYYSKYENEEESGMGSEYRDSTMIEKYNKFLSDLNIDKGEFYIREMYTINPNSRYRVCFACGDIIYNENTAKQTAMFTIVENIETKEYVVEIYGTNYKNIFNYTENLADITFKEENLQNFEVVSELGSYVYEEKELSDEDIAYWFYECYKIKALNFPEIAYNMLDEKYKEKRFENSFDNFKEYINEYSSTINEAVLSQYSKENINGYTLYTLVDTKNNSYFVKVPSNSASYKIFLDTYTIPYDGYEEKYMKMNDSDKAATNMQMFINMINTKDYQHAYNVLDETFKQNNFETLDKFKNYIKNNLFENNIVSTSEVNIVKNYFEGIIMLRNNSGHNSESKTLNIIMQLKEDTDFVMSFNIE